MTPEDVKTVAPAALAHRITLRPELWLRQVDPADVVAEICADTPAPPSEALPSYRGLRPDAAPAAGGAAVPRPATPEDGSSGRDEPDDPVYRYTQGVQQ